MKHLAEHKNNEASVIEQSGHSFLVIRNMDHMRIDEVQYHSAVIIEVTNYDFAKLVVSSIRSNHSPDVYLKPIFLWNKDGTEYSVLDNLANGSIKDLDQIESIVPIVERIATRIQDLSFTNSVSFEAQIITKLITLLYAKEEKTVEPIPYAYSSISYFYPLLSVNFDRSEEHTALKILEIAENEGILRSDYYDRIYLCSSCSSSHLTYREVCPKCSSSNTTPDDIVHHFPCGYVGPMRDYKNAIDDKLDCPKCNKRLRHIGVDYDKPSVMHDCNNCSHQFQDYNVNARCLSCHSDKPVETLLAKEIKTYRLTKKGELAAIKGFTSTTKDIDETIGTINYGTFKTMLKYEIERLKQIDGASNICAINISNSSHVYSKLGGELQRGLLKDLVSVIRSNIRSSDVIAFESSDTIVLSMNSIPNKIAKKITVEMVNLLNDLILNSFENIEVNFATNVVELDKNKSHEVQLKGLLQDFI